MNVDLTRLPGVAVGVVAGSRDGRPLVRLDGGEAMPADVLFTPDTPDWARCEGLRVALAFVDTDATRRLVLGLLDPPPREAEQQQQKETSTAKPDSLRIESGRELVIECGKAKIALRADGRVEIRGGHLVSRSSGPNKIKGGTVHIN